MGKRYLHRHPSKEEKQVTKKHIKRRSVSLINRDMQVKATRHHVAFIRMSITKRAEHKYWQECGELRTLAHCSWECNMVQPLWKMVSQVLKKMNVGLPNAPAILLLGIYSKELKAET